LDDTIKTKIDSEISRINNNIEKHKFLFDLYESGKEPELRDIESGGAFLQSFYNGVENITSMILKGINNEEISNNAQWHTNLLNKAFETTEKRIALFDSKYKKQLNDYKSFRHVFRHKYGYEIDWEDVKPLIGGVKELWENIKYDINNFIKKC